MSEQQELESGDVSVSMEITGSYDNVLAKLNRGQESPDVLEPFIQDVESVLTTIERMEEGTRSSVARNLPDGMTVDYDAEEVVDLLQVLKRYDLVVLEGNTWKVSPKYEG
ncbi:hypothetical protein [Halorussus sp. AFM4]|uniref:hypothetical protein n=1 Tax=Halorussus sp. AFM4 TaxID=3421651 RepID=UPI003EBDAF0F